MGLQLLDNASCVNHEPWRYPSRWASDRILYPPRNGKTCAAVSLIACSTGHAPIKPAEDLETSKGDLEVLAELAEEDTQLEAELEGEIANFEKRLGDFELRAMLSGPYDSGNAFLSIQAGTGGTEACDWAQMLMRMYLRWAERHGYTAELVDELRNEEAGIRSATLRISGDYAYGYLQGETGVHRLVR